MSYVPVPDSLVTIGAVGNARHVRHATNSDTGCW